MHEPAFTLSPADRDFVLAVVRRVLPCEHAANDATQDALLAAFRHFASFRGEAALRTWLYRIARTTALGYLRRQRRMREELAADPARVVEPVDPGPGPDELARGRRLVARVEAALFALQRGQREVIALRLAEHTEPEIAAHLGISVANVKIRAFRARTRLRAAIAA